NTVYSPESEPFRADREFDGIGGKFRWRAFHTDKGYVNLERFYARPFGESNVAYAVCWVHAGRARPAVLATGSDDGLKVWIDRKLVLDRAVHREAVPGEDTQRIDLPAEWAEVLVKVDNQFGRWGFYLELRDPDTGRPLEGVQVRPTPPPGVQPRPGPGGHVFLRSWQVIGPFPNPDHHGRSVYPPEQEKFDPAREYNGLKGKVRWKQDDSPTDYIDLAHPCNTVEPALAYAVCWVRSDRARPVVLSLGSNDGIKVWLNRKEVFTHDIWRSANPGQDTTRADLQAGWNELLVKDDNQGGPWGFYLELRDPDTNRPLAGAEIRATPPGEALKPGQAGHAFVRDWQVVGPFPNPNRTAHATPLPPETQPYNPSHEYQGIKGRVRWQLLQSSTDYIDLAHWFAHRQAAVAYARCWVHADRKRPALLSIGSNDGIKIWINHQQVFAHEIGRSARPGQDGARSELEAGWNEVLVKVDNFDNDWGFYLEFQDPGTNRPLEGIDFRSTPPAAGNK
ncbi:MAG: hypothetical protein JO112_05675, partial [Planctomycetes bacterium]|nr:hypothetical protein [Planctomycetota bacterium]